MYNFTIEPNFKQLFPKFIGAAITAQVTNTPSNDDLWKEMAIVEQQLYEQYTTETIKQRVGIAATRQAYKVFGKDPSRYRPACEQLARRVLQGKGLYHVNTIVDILNLISLKFGYSTAALNASVISGNNISLGIGQANEPYEGIGRGILNIEHLPVYRDALGAFATPTSDSTRTMISDNTTQLLVIINGYDGQTECLQQATLDTITLLEHYANATNVEHVLY